MQCLKAKSGGAGVSREKGPWGDGGREEKRSRCVVVARGSHTGKLPETCRVPVEGKRIYGERAWHERKSVLE